MNVKDNNGTNANVNSLGNSSGDYSGTITAMNKIYDLYKIVSVISKNIMVFSKEFPAKDTAVFMS